MTASPRRLAVRAAGRIARSVGALGSRPEQSAPARRQPEPPTEAGRKLGPSAGSGRTAPIDPRFRRSHWRLGRLLLGDEATAPTPEDVAFDQAAAQAMVAKARVSLARARFSELIERGATIHQAHAETVRALLREANQPAAAKAFTLGLSQLPEGAEIRAIGRGLSMHKLLYFRQAWQQFRTCDPALLAAVVPVEAADCALIDGSEEAVRTALELVADPTALTPIALVRLAGRFEATGHHAVATRLVEEAGSRDPEDLDDHHTQMLSRLRGWTHPAPARQVGVADGINVGVLDYRSPDFERASRNVGDYVQTLAMLGNLARFQGARFHGDDGIDDLLRELQGRVRPELRLEGGTAEVNLVPVSRDYSEGDRVPENTWCLAFGWHMHPLFLIRHGFPYHPNLNPIFVSFHVNRPDMLTDEAVTYLREHQPIGCRDWTTVDLLLSAGVDAFFTGCLTTTVNAVFPDTDQVRDPDDRVVAVIDLPRSAVKKAKRPVEVVTHAAWENKELGLVRGVHAASDLLSSYQRRYHRIATSRLHSYLPATSLGVPVTFTPDIPGDVRFEGLYGMEPGAEAFEDMRDGIRHLVAETFSLILDGADKASVRARWADLTASRVEEAKDRFTARPRDLHNVGFDAPAAARTVQATRRTLGPEVPSGVEVTDIALSSDANFRGHLAVCLESIVVNATGTVRVWITGRGLSGVYQQWLCEAFPQVPITFFDFDGVDYGDIRRMLGHITVTTMDRLLLPDLLPELDRITYIDIDTVTEGDVAELARTELGGKPLAARTGEQVGSQLWRFAGNLLPVEDAAELRRSMSQRHAFDFKTLNAGVLVLDLARMRADDFTQTWLQMAPVYGLNDQDILNAYVGPDRVELEPRWNALPVLEDVTDPAIVHYAGVGKPWDDQLTPYADRWQRYRERVRSRVEWPPPR